MKTLIKTITLVFFCTAPPVNAGILDVVSSSVLKSVGGLIDTVRENASGNRTNPENQVPQTAETGNTNQVQPMPQPATDPENPGVLDGFLSGLKKSAGRLLDGSGSAVSSENDSAKPSQGSAPPLAPLSEQQKFDQTQVAPLSADKNLTPPQIQKPTTTEAKAHKPLKVHASASIQLQTPALAPAQSSATAKAKDEKSILTASDKKISTPRQETGQPKSVRMSQGLSAEKVKWSEFCRKAIATRTDRLVEIQNETSAGLEDSLRNAKEGMGIIGSLLGAGRAVEGMYRGPTAKSGTERFIKEQYAADLQQLAKNCVGLELGEMQLPLADDLMQLDSEIATMHSRIGGVGHVPKFAFAAALIFQDVGQYQRAESIYRNALDDKMLNLFAPMNPAVLEPLKALADMYFTAGRNSDAVQLYDEFIEHQKDNLEKSQFMRMMVYPQAAAAYSRNGNDKKAASLLENAKSLWSDAATSGNENSQDSLVAMNALGGSFQMASEMAGSLNKGNPYTRSARGNAIDPSSATIDKIYLQLGSVYVRLGRDQELKRLYEVDFKNLVRASGGSQFGKDNKEVPTLTKGSQAASNIMPTRGTLSFARMFSRRGMQAEARAAYLDAFQFAQPLLLQRWVKFALAEDSNRYIFQLYKQVFTEYLASVVGVSATDTNNINLAFKQLLQFKGSLSDFDNTKALVLRSHRNDTLSSSFAELAALSEQLENIDKEKLYSSGDKSSFNSYIELVNKRVLLERKITQSIGDDIEKIFLDKRQGDLVSKLIEALPKNANFIDFVKLPNQYKDGDKPSNQYVAFILSPSQKSARLVKLGDAQVIDSLVTNYQKSIRNALDNGQEPQEKKLNEIGRQLYNKVIAPLGIAGAAQQWVVSPDSGLQLVPFETFVMPSGHYLIQDVAISYVTSGMDLLRGPAGDEQIKTALIIAAPDYGVSVSELPSGNRNASILMPLRKSAVMHFSALDDTKIEANSLASMLLSKNVATTTLLSTQATKTGLLDTGGTSLLHIATHGFFLSDEGTPSPLSSSKTQDEFDLSAGKQETNPMYRAGLALTGANVNQRQGVLYASEIAGFDLSKTSIAVLSACDTGVGDVESGDGVFGLKRAFMIAGARSVVTSLWPVSSNETTQLMKSFYEVLVKSSNRAAALQESKLQIMKKYHNPFYWGSFVLTGNPTL
jgi:CHAT domain-containing protein